MPKVIMNEVCHDRLDTNISMSAHEHDFVDIINATKKHDCYVTNLIALKS